MKNRSLKAGGRLNRWSFKAGFTVIKKGLKSRLVDDQLWGHYPINVLTSLTCFQLLVSSLTFAPLLLSAFDFLVKVEEY